jgi:hypothetical protein
MKLGIAICHRGAEARGVIAYKMAKKRYVYIELSFFPLSYFDA